MSDFFQQNPFALMSLLHFVWFALLIFLYWLWSPEKLWQLRTVFIIGFTALMLRVSMDLSFLVSSVLSPVWYVPLVFVSMCVLCPLPRLLEKYSTGRVLWPVFTFVFSVYIFIDPAFLLFRGHQVAQLNGTRKLNAFVIQQSTSYTCGPSCAASILTDFGVPLTEGETCVLLNTSSRGTAMTRILHLFKEKLPEEEVRYIAFDKAKWEEAPSWASVVQVYVKALNDRDIAHVVLAYPCPKGTKIRVKEFMNPADQSKDYICKENLLAIGDPLEPYGQLFTLEDFKEKYRPYGTAIQVKISDPQLTEKHLKKHPLLLSKSLLEEVHQE